jgi:tocopherol O-methyltransferase
MEDPRVNGSPLLPDVTDSAPPVHSHDAAHRAIAEYYDYTVGYYRTFWHGSTGAIHYGLGDGHTRCWRDELLNTNRIMARRAEISRRDRVLDAGCGVGGSSVWLAREYGARVVGITLSPAQLARARDTAKQQSLGEYVEFDLRDYAATGLPARSFDVVWALESSCYAADKSAFVREAHRLLRPGGRLIVGDGFLKRLPRTSAEAAAYDAFKRGLVLPDLVRPQDLEHEMKVVGFDRVEIWDHTEGARRSSQRLYRRCLIAHPLSRILESLGIVSPIIRQNIRAGIAQRTLVRSGVAGYFLIRADRAGDDPGLRPPDRACHEASNGRKGSPRRDPDDSGI